jgi:hypothetical protein
MARGDVISDWEVAIGATTTVSVQPASGVEWMITKISHTLSTVNNMQMYPVSTDAGLYTALGGGETAAVVVLDVLLHAAHGAKLFVTNSQYFRVRNNNAGAQQFIYSGVQTK